MTTIDELRKVIRTHPIVDNHGHNILRPDQLRTHDFLSISSEATGLALLDHCYSVAHMRAACQLRRLYALPETATWSDILASRLQSLQQTPTALIKDCFHGTQTILIDDGLAKPDLIEPYNWHSQYTTTPCKRIVRIEAIAADIFEKMHALGELPSVEPLPLASSYTTSWETFARAFQSAIQASLEDDEVVGFKSVVCYRTGLDVALDSGVFEFESLVEGFRHYLPGCVKRQFKVEHKSLNDFLVLTTCRMIETHHLETGTAKPFQFHTGLGDNDISLLRSNPAYLQPLIKAFPQVPFVLLHSAYPYTREAGYLATVYKNVFLDIGEVFPMVSRDGQEHIIHQALELTPSNKILWSTDGHFFPETYWLANVQGREAIEKVFVEYVEKGDITAQQAITMVKQILFENSNLLYNLGLPSQMPVGKPLPDPAMADSGDRVASTLGTSETQTVLGETSRTENLLQSMKYVVVQWMDYMGTLRTRWLLVPAFRALVDGRRYLTISQGNLGTLQNDAMSPDCNPVGTIRVSPDVGSLKPMHASESIRKTASVMASFVEANGDGLDTCPRSFCARQEMAWQNQEGFEILVGFEIEVTFCRRGEGGYQPLDTKGHAWGSLSDEQSTSTFKFMCDIADALTDIGIGVQQFHSEAGAGQYEFVLPPLPPVQAIDSLIQARQCIQQIAAARNLRATCHPMPFPGIGTAAHAHISLNHKAGSTSFEENALKHTIAALLAHLPALCAITMPQVVSYNRVVDNSWTGGTWIAWGTENREVPLRRVTHNRFEVRCLDGTANMYLAIGAILALGLHGCQKSKKLTIGDCTVNPSSLTADGRSQLGIKEKMPKNLQEAINSMRHDSEFSEIVPESIISHYVSLKIAEQKMLAEMNEDTRHVWLLDRY